MLGTHQLLKTLGNRWRPQFYQASLLQQEKLQIGSLLRGEYNLSLSGGEGTVELEKII